MFIVITFLVLHNLYVRANYYNAVRYRQSYTNDFADLLSKVGISLRELKQLSKTFPKHVIEVQIERMQEKQLQKPKYYVDQTRLGGNPPYQILRLPAGQSNEKPSNNIVTSSSTSKIPTSTTTTTTMTTAAPITEMSTTTITSTPRTTYSPSPEHTGYKKRPLYMEDLIQALEDYEKNNGYGLNHRDKRIDSTSTEDDGNRPLVKKDLWELLKNINCTSNQESNKQESSSYEQPTSAKIYPKISAVKNFNDVLTLMKKGVKVKFEATTPADMSNGMLNWVPIKIQKQIFK